MWFPVDRKEQRGEGVSLEGASVDGNGRGVTLCETDEGGGVGVKGFDDVLCMGGKAKHSHNSEKFVVADGVEGGGEVNKEYIEFFIVKFGIFHNVYKVPNLSNGTFAFPKSFL